MFVDEITIEVEAGKGGDGIIHFRREKYVPRGGPDGGDGGEGGDVYFKVDPHVNTLGEYRHQKHFKAEDGERGGGSNRTGVSGQDLFLKVPSGTMVYDQDNQELLGDLKEPGETLLVCKGGRGGRGNARFKSSNNKAPRIAEKGEPPQKRTLRLELKLIADVGLVGVPNAGKSTLLSVVSNATPKIAAYPFTTLEPNLGVVEMDLETQFVMADIPGLIEGAHQGEGLGDEFLRHIERTQVLIHLLDGLSSDPMADFSKINRELALFNPGLTEKPQIVVLNKLDLPQVKEKWPRVKQEIMNQGYQDVFAISAATNSGVRPVLYRAAEILAEIPEQRMEGEETGAEMPVYRLEEDPGEFKILKSPRGWKIESDALERAAAMTYWDYHQSVRRFQRILESLGIDDALRRAGIKPGDTVFIGDHELIWEE
jgi:GTP-binding protein